MIFDPIFDLVSLTPTHTRVRNLVPMDGSALTKAYDYARVHEHILAAGQFAQACQYTTNTEALRTLKLLEDHHRRLAKLLKLPHDRRPIQPADPAADRDDTGQVTISIAVPVSGAAPPPSTVVHPAVPSAVDATQQGTIPIDRNQQSPLGEQHYESGQSVQSSKSQQLLSPLEQERQELPQQQQQPRSQPHPQLQSRKPHQQQYSNQGPSAPRSGAHNLASRLLQPPGLSTKRRLPPRDLSSSIASNLASARGIRGKHVGHALPPSVSTDQAPGNLESHSRNQLSKSNAIQTADENLAGPDDLGPSAGREDGEKPYAKELDSAAHSAHTLDQDKDGFSRFYSTFGFLLNRLSAPLAFAGLPLLSDEAGSPPLPKQPEAAPVRSRSPLHSPLQPQTQTQAQAQAQSQTQMKPQTQPQTQTRRAKFARTGSSLSAATSTNAAEPDLSKIFSRATLRAISRDGPGAATDSFYVVPTSGHTVSYANILHFAKKEKRRMEEAKAALDNPARADAAVDRDHDDTDNDDDDDDDFSDAREAPGPLSPGTRRRLGRARSERELSNTIEELYLENRSLKDALDKLSQRLHAFEASAQTSHLALAESMRLIRPSSPLSVGGASGRLSELAADEPPQELRKRVIELEDQLAQALRDNETKQLTLNKYRERWELIKAGAKARREAQAVTESGDG